MDERQIIAGFAQLKAALNTHDRAAINAQCMAFLNTDPLPPLGDRWQSLAKLLQHNGELQAARRAMEAYVAHHGNIAGARFHLAALLAQTGQTADAQAIMQSIPQTVPDVAGNAFIQGTLAVNLGSVDEARAHLLRALDAKPALGQALLSLAVLEKITPGHVAEQRAAIAAPLMAQQPAAEQAHFHFACGKIAVDKGDWAAAFDHYDKGAALVRSFRPYDKEQDAQDAVRAVAGYSADGLTSGAGPTEANAARPIFVTGLPRSGTTLVEQILTSHSAVMDGEELGIGTRLIREIGGNDAESLRRYAQAKGMATLRDLYLHLAQQRFPGTARFIDKSLNVSRQMGVLATVLPDAPILWLRRDPVDCAWSCFRTYFLRGLDWSWSLTDMAHHFRLEDQLHAKWADLLGPRMLTIDYEALVSDPQTHIARILAHCGLDEETAPYAPHENRRVVSTASVMQVRRPINRDAVGANEAVRAFMRPFVESYTTQKSA